jgi:hypothetical protein
MGSAVGRGGGVCEGEKGEVMERNLMEVLKMISMAGVYYIP